MDNIIGNIMNKFLLTMFLFFLTGCSSTNWTHSYKSIQQFNADKAFCMAQAGQAVNGLKGLPAMMARSNAYESCMMGKGWSEID